MKLESIFKISDFSVVDNKFVEYIYTYLLENLFPLEIFKIKCLYLLYCFFFILFIFTYYSPIEN